MFLSIEMIMKFAKRYPILFFFPLASLLMLYGITSFSCKKEETKNISSDIVFPDSIVSFAHHVEPLFRQTCIFSGCHGGSQPAGGLTLEGDMWSVLVAPTSNLIIPKDGNDSPLIKYLDGRLLPKMPLGGTLTTNQINGVKKWIDEGASAL
jgi:hypothetical protein